MLTQLQELAENPIRKIIRYRGESPPMFYEVAREYGRHKLKVSIIEIEFSEGIPTYYVFVNKKLDDGSWDGVDYLWKTEKCKDVSVEYDLSFDEDEL